VLILSLLFSRNSEEKTNEALSSYTILNESHMSIDSKNSFTERDGRACSARRQKAKNVVGVSNDIRNNETDVDTTPTASQEFSPSFIEGIRRKKQQASADKKTQKQMLLNELTVDEDINDENDVAMFSPKTLPMQDIPAKNYLRIDEISLHTAIELKTICFGNAKTSFNAEWRRQGFYFSKHPELRYGLIQEKGGPCGLLASVQAWILKCLIVDAQQQETRTHIKGLHRHGLLMLFLDFFFRSIILISTPVRSSKSLRLFKSKERKPSLKFYVCILIRIYL